MEGRPLEGLLVDGVARTTAELGHGALAWFGCSLATLEAMSPPELVALVAGVRGGKSKLVAAATVWGCLRVDCDQATDDEEIFFPVVAPRSKVARATYVQVLGLLLRPELAGVLEGKPLAEEIRVRRPQDDRVITIIVVAASAGGITVRARWLAGLVLDEVAQFGQESAGAVVNVEEMLGAAEPRILPGGVVWLASSPYGPQGLLYETWKEHYGRPCFAEEQATLVVWAPTSALNTAFDARKVAKLRARDPDRAAREIDAAWTDPDTQWYPSPWVDACTREEPLERPREDGVTYVATMDPATRGNAWTLTVAGKRWRDGRQVATVVLAREWIGSRGAPLDPKATLLAVRDLCAIYGVDMVETDQWSSDALRSIAGDLGLFVVERRIGADRFDLYDSLRTMLGAGDVELPPLEQVRTDLLGVRRRLSAGGVAVHLPTTADGRHCDYAPALVLALARPLPDPVPLPNTRTEAELVRDELAELQQRRIDAIETEGGRSWWERDA